MPQNTHETANDIKTRVGKFLANTPDKNAAAVLAFVERLYQSYCDAEKEMQWQLIVNVGTWAAFYAITSGVIDEVTISSLKIAKLNYVSALAPAAVGFASYTLASASFLSLNLGVAFWACMEGIVPAAYEQDLEMMLGPTTFVRAERITKRGESGIERGVSSAFGYTIILFGMLGTLASLAHLSYVIWHIDAISVYFSLLSIAIGFIFWLRSGMLWLRTGDF